MTINVVEIVDSIFHTTDEAAIEALMWTCTPFPFCGDEGHLRVALQEAYDHGCGTIEGAICWSHLQLDIAMSDI